MKTLNNTRIKYSGNWRHKMQPMGLFGREEAPVLQHEILINSHDENGNFVLVNEWKDADQDSHQKLDPEGYQGLFDRHERRIG